MNLVNLVIALALLQFFIFCMAVGTGTRRPTRLTAPATTGNEVFERYFRVQMNTLEHAHHLRALDVLFAIYLSPYWAAAWVRCTSSGASSTSAAT